MKKEHIKDLLFMVVDFYIQMHQGQEDGDITDIQEMEKAIVKLLQDDKCSNCGTAGAELYPDRDDDGFLVCEKCL